MTQAALWLALLAAGTLAMLAVPFVPAWREVRRPTDHRPLAVDGGYTSRADFFARRLREQVRDEGVPPRGAGAPLYVEGDYHASAQASLAAVLATGDIELPPGCVVRQWAHADGTIRMGRGGTALRRMSAHQAIELARDCSFERLNAPTLRFGSAAAHEAPPAPPLVARDLAELHDCEQMAPGWFRVVGHVVLPPDSSYRGALVVTGALSIGARCVIEGDVKARHGIVIGRGARVLGSLVSERSIQLERDSFVRGPLISESDVVISRGCAIGTPALRTTVTAENVMVESGAVAHGTVWAREVGVVWASA